ncbi:MAG: EamA family transporter [Verrucomicrobiota bacterium]
MLTALFVFARIVANPVSNVFQKQLAQRAANPVFIIGVTHALLTLMVLPFMGGMWAVKLGSAFWTNMAICAVLAVVGNVLLVYALRSTDLSVLGPINAYKAVLSLGLGVFLIGEIPTAFGLVGVLLILAGSYCVVDRAPDQPRGDAFVQFFRERGVQLRFAALVFSATEAVFLKRAVLHSSPVITFCFWSILGLPVATAAIVVLLSGEVGQEIRRLRQHWRTYVWLAMTTGLMQLTTLLTFGKLQVGYSLALFQLSSLISVFLGYRYFRERNIRRRLVGAVIMVAGAALIVALGRRA